MKRISLFSLVVLFLASGVSNYGQIKKAVNSAADLPGFRFPLNEPASALLDADDATFSVFGNKVASTIDSVLSGYDIRDSATQRDLLGARLDLELLNGNRAGAQVTADQILIAARLHLELPNGNRAGALATIDQIRALDEKPAAWLTEGLLLRPLLNAWQQTGSDSNAAFRQAFEEDFLAELRGLPWAVTQDTLKKYRADLELVSKDLLLGSAKESLDPQVAKTGGLDLPAAEALIQMRVAEKFQLPLARSALAVLQPYILAHDVKKPNIWPARDVTLAREEKLTPVRIAIFDSGVDTALYPGHLFDDPHHNGHSPHGLAFDLQGNLIDSVLQPLSSEQRQLYPRMVSFGKGLVDLNYGIDSVDADEARKTLTAMPPDRAAPFLKQLNFLGQYLHGTHVAGIAIRGNPAARLVVVEFNDSLSEIPFEPTMAWVEKFKADFHEVGDYLREHDVRVVNVSWADNQAEFEQWLSKTSALTDPSERKKLAGQLFAVWREGLEDAIRAAPNTLWVCAAGDSDSNASFLGDVPASLELPNLVTVGAVDQAGDETSFTSYGKTVMLYADGYQVDSYVPGGKRIRLSGTSVASPNVANLAAKLIALDPRLTPEQTIALMEKGATAGADGRIHLIDPKNSVELLQKELARQKRQVARIN